MVIDAGFVEAGSVISIPKPLLKGALESTTRFKERPVNIDVPRGMTKQSVEYRIMHAISRDGYQLENGDVETIAHTVLSYLNHKLTIERTKDGVKLLMDKGYIYVVENDAGKFEVKVIDALSRGRGVSDIKFSHLGLDIVLDGTDFENLSLEDLTLVKMLHMQSIGSRGIPQEVALGDFLVLAEKGSKEEAEEILNRLRVSGFISPNGDERMHLTDAGESHVIQLLHGAGALNIPDLPVEEAPVEDINSIRDRFKDMGATIIGNGRRVGYREYYNEVVQEGYLSPETVQLLIDLQEYIDSRTKVDSSTNGDIDENIVSKKVFETDRFQEAQLTCSALSDILRQKSSELSVWQVRVFLSSQTERNEGYIPTVFTLSKEYNIESVVADIEMVTPRFRVRIVGNRAVVEYYEDVTVKDIAGLVAMSNDFDEIYESAKDNLPNRRVKSKSKQAINASANGLVNIGHGEQAYFPELNQPGDPTAALALPWPSEDNQL